MRLILLALVFLVPLFQADVASAQGNADAGKKLWESADARCRDCHGVKGEGGLGPDLAGRLTSFEQFRQAVRKPWGIMPAFPENQHSDQELRDFFAYFGGLPKVGEPGPWRIPLPAGAPKGQELLIATYGCGQCHGAVMQGPRADAGAINADLEWFRRMVFEHTTVMPEHRKLLNEAPARVRMGNYSRTRVPEPALAEMWRYIKDDLKFRAALLSRLTPGTSAGTYNLLVQNEGLAGKGLAAEDITILLALTPGTKVTNTTGTGYQGVRNDPELKAEAAVWQLPRLRAKEDQNYTITVSPGGGIARGVVRWTKPVQGTGMPDQINVAVPAPAQTN
jgi:mono/diheme cytochrome c family protein